MGLKSNMYNVSVSSYYKINNLSQVPFHSHRTPATDCHNFNQPDQVFV